MALFNLKSFKKITAGRESDDLHAAPTDTHRQKNTAEQAPDK
jgi:hypothetical protein